MFRGYALLGDDIVLIDLVDCSLSNWSFIRKALGTGPSDKTPIVNFKVSKEYRDLMVGDCGVNISPVKSHYSPFAYEFAKRWIR